MNVHIVTVLMLAFAVASMQAIPRNKRQSNDEPRLSNEVIPGTLEDLDEAAQDANVPMVVTAEDEPQQTTVTTPALDDTPTSKPPNKKKKPTDTFSRVIDDIFNIPISVLRAVNTLLSNAFGTKQTVESPAATSSLTSA